MGKTQAVIFGGTQKMNVAIVYILISVLGGAVGQILLKKRYEYSGAGNIELQPNWCCSLANDNKSICGGWTWHLCSGYCFLAGCTFAR